MKRFIGILLLFLHSLAAQQIDDLGITVNGAGRQFVFTNKEAGTYHGEVNADNTGGWQGWFVNAEKIFHDYSLRIRNTSLDRTRASSVVYPDRLVRRYSGRASETVTFLDSIDALLIEINHPQADISLRPADVFVKDNAVIGSRERWNRNASSPRTTINSITVATQRDKKSSLFVIAAGNNAAQADSTASLVLRQTRRFTKNRNSRMQSILARSFTRFNDPRLTKALGWAKLQLDALIMNQSTGGRRTKGIFAGLPWFNNYWGRDSFIALPGATYVTGNFDDARAVLLSYAAFQETDSASSNFGRIPNLATPQSVIYNTADGTPWFIRSLYEYVKYSGDTSLVRELYPVIVRSIEGTVAHHTDSLGFLTHGDAETWMDAVGPGGPWSPRGNRANDVQSLWHQQLMIGTFCAEFLFDYARASQWKNLADTLDKNFRRYFIDTATMTIHDHLNSDGSPSTELRPNQLLTFDMMIPEDVRQRMVKNVVARLVYDHGTATLAQEDTNFHPYHEYPPYYVKDAAYHNGTIWTWLNGPMMYAATRYDLQDVVFPVIENSVHQILDRGCVGTLSELLDAFPRRTGSALSEPRLSGTYSQAWSLSEFIRTLHQDYIGVSVDLPSHTMRINPKMPVKITSFETMQHIGNGSVRISFSRIGDSVSVTVVPGNLDAAFGIHYLYVSPGGDAVNAPVELPPETPLTIAHTPSALTLFHGKEIVLQQHDAPTIFLKNFSDKKYFTGLALAQPDHDKDYPVLRGPSHPLLSHRRVRTPGVKPRHLFTVTDPAGDDKGEAGTYHYPASPHFPKGILDITKAEFFYDTTNLYCTLTFSQLYDPGWHPEYGFQLTLAAIAINTGSGRQREIGLNSSYRLDASRAFDRLIVVGGGIRVTDDTGTTLCEYLPRMEDASDPIGKVKEKKIVFAIPLEYLGTPNERWKVTILVGGQDDHGGAGIGEFRSVNAEASEWQGGGKTKKDDSHVYDSVLIN